MSDPNLALATRAVESVKDITDDGLNLFRVLTINTDADCQWAVDVVKDVKAQWAALDKQRKDLTAPLAQVQKGINELFRTPLLKLVESEQLLKSKIADYAVRKDRERQAVMLASTAQYQAGGTPTAIIPEPAQMQGASVRFEWGFEVTDPDLVPRELCTPDPDKIKAKIWYADTPHKEPLPIPGIRFVQKQIVTVRK